MKGSQREERSGREPLWRDALGAQLRQSRQQRGQTLAEVAWRAGISMQYLSEVERGMKEPSSEMIAAIAGSLDLTLEGLTRSVADRLSSGSAVKANAGGWVALALAA